MSIHIRYLMVAFSKKNTCFFCFFNNTARSLSPPRWGNRNIKQMATTDPCDPNIG